MRYVNLIFGFTSDKRSDQKVVICRSGISNQKEHDLRLTKEGLNI